MWFCKTDPLAYNNIFNTSPIGMWTFIAGSLMYQHRECLNASVKSMTRLGKKMVEIGSGFLGKSFFFCIMKSEMVMFLSNILLYSETDTKYTNF